MGTLSRTLLVACALAAGPVAGAAASDFRFPPQPVVPFPEAIPVPEYSAWYLRGDLGFAVFEEFDMSRSGTAFSSPGMDDSWSIGAGLGYNFTDNIRGDVTIDHHLETDLDGANPLTAAPTRGVLSSTVTLANIYFDFRDRDHFSPYAGAGLGFAYNRLEESNGATVADENVDLSAAAMAGFSYNLGNDWLVDAGYRFLYLGEAQTVSTATGALSVDDIFVHELRVGVRYEFR